MQRRIRINVDRSTKGVETPGYTVELFDELQEHDDKTLRAMAIAETKALHEAIHEMFPLRIEKG